MKDLIIQRPIPDLLKDKQKHIQIIGLFIRAKGIEFESPEQISSYIRRNAKVASELKIYSLERIIKTMVYLRENANYKWTLETVLKHIDENLDELKVKTTLKQDPDAWVKDYLK